MTSPMIEWDHSLEWAVANFAGKGSARSGECVIDIDLSKGGDAYLSGHAIDGRVLFPATGYLVSKSANCANSMATIIFLLQYSLTQFLSFL